MSLAVGVAEGERSAGSGGSPRLSTRVQNLSYWARTVLGLSDISRARCAQGTEAVQSLGGTRRHKSNRSGIRTADLFSP